MHDYGGDIAIQTAALYLENLIATLHKPTENEVLLGNQQVMLETKLFRQLDSFFTTKWPQVIALFSTPEDVPNSLAVAQL
jgi:hypothetical protein